ncbi:MAG: DNA-directed RNA polymerase subunit L [Candidatus Diapherotrites archaeon]|uniref:DNA-directed RNA polymerase subunit Rpo11 n=1 Tax=Candidatus Iainarchaeum sp. TaxID=3101447 RepID=A0A8T4L8N5_9ARCH|nr:DNA-directed RNA polymerase subunit L [Candidatus Diapherotrites archaeon]
MEIKVLKNESNEIEFVLKDNRHTFPNLLRDRLLQDKSVTFAAYKLMHPLDNEAHIIVKTSGKNAKTALNDAVKQIDEDLEEFEKQLKKALK